jgi:hypothetical protein
MKAVVEDFLNALIKGDLSEACKYYCRESARAIWESNLDIIKAQLKQALPGITEFTITKIGKPRVVNASGYLYKQAYVYADVYLENGEGKWHKADFALVIDSGQLIIESFGYEPSMVRTPD